MGTPQNEKPTLAGKSGQHENRQSKVTPAPKAVKTRERSTYDSPWCWCSKDALHQIRDNLDATNSVTSGLAVYWALCEIASDKESPSFATTHAFLALRTGLSPRCIRSRLSDLAQLGLISVQTPALKAPSHYIVLPIGNGCRAIGNGRDQACLPRSEQHQKNAGRKKEKHTPGCELSAYAEGTQGEESPTGETDPLGGNKDVEQIYALYPRHVGKPRAIKAIARAVKQFGAELVAAKTKDFAAAWADATGDEMRYCPYPATWYGDERFNDSPDTWRHKDTPKAQPSALRGTNI